MRARHGRSATVATHGPLPITGQHREAMNWFLTAQQRHLTMTTLPWVSIIVHPMLYAHWNIKTT
jgi:hypothetical protein